MTGARIPSRSVIVLVLLAAVVFSREGLSNEPSPPVPLKDCLPARVNLLRELLKQMPDKQKASVAASTDYWMRQAKESTFYWIVKIIERDWLPPDPNVLRKSIVMLQNAFGPNDVTYSRWEAHNHIAEVVQTETIFLICVRPVAPERVPKKITKVERAALAKDTVSSLVRTEIDFVLNEPTGRKKVKKTIMPEVLVGSFERASVQACDDAVHGKCAPPQVLEGDVYHYIYWWRCINWWRILGTVTGFWR